MKKSGGSHENLLPALLMIMLFTAKSAGAVPIQETQDQVFAAASLERLEMHIAYQRGPAAKRPAADTKFYSAIYSAKNPAFYQISRQEQVLDIMRSVTATPEDHRTACSDPNGNTA